MRTPRFTLAWLIVCAATAAWAAPSHEKPQFTPVEEELDVDPTTPVAAKVLQDTIWIADWSFDTGGECTEAGWVKYDNRILNDGSNYWQVTTDYADGVISNFAAVLRKHDLCWAQDGYGNDWDYSIILKYWGSNATLSFAYRADTEAGFDFVTVEGDSLGLSESRVDYSVDPAGTPEALRDRIWMNSGEHILGSVVAPLSLPDYGPGVHEAYLRFISDGAASPEDGEQPSALGAALVVDQIVVTGGLAYSENFEGVLNPNVTLVNTAVATPFGLWARLYQHITDNDKCNENITCAWLFTDPTYIGAFADMQFGPGAAVIRPWADQIIVSPWASLASTPSAQRTILSFRRFPGNRFTQGGVVQNWRVRGKVKIENTDTSAAGDSVDCVSPWGHTSMFNSLNQFVWVTSLFDATAFFASNSSAVQFSFRVSDWRYLTGAPPPATLNTGPGPYTDRIRIGRRVLSGPVFDIGLDTRFQGQDNFASTVNSGNPGQHHSPVTDRFGTSDFRMGQDQGTDSSFRILSGDSVTTNILDTRQAGGITSVKWCGAIVAGPHAGKAPPPYAVGANGFFETTPDSSRSSNGAVVANRWARDLADSYFRGGDQLLYYWYATDAAGGVSSAPAGLTSPPASVTAAEAATQGLFEVTFLPTIDWSPTYLGRIAADAHGELTPTPAELAESSQRNCILYYQHTTSNRRSGPANATSFMRTLNALGYDGDYDVFDPQGYGNTNNQLGGLSTVAQWTGYQLIVEDDGRSNLTPNVPDGENTDNAKVRQATMYRNWLDGAMNSEAGRASLWILGESSATEFAANAAFWTYCGISTAVQDQGLGVNPDVVGQTSFAFAPTNCTASFSGDVFSLNGGCPTVRNYDGFTAGGTAVATHKYRGGTTLGPAAVLMNARPATNANTIVMGFGWFDVRSPVCTPPGCPSPSTPAKALASKILACALTAGCQEPLDPSGVPGADEVDVPPVSALHQNVPNPFNPTTKIAFDLARPAHVRLEVFDVEGRSVRMLLDEMRSAGRNHQVVWDGLDATGARASSGVYFYRLVAGDLTATRKMILLK